jgi:hypothetical protein
MPFMTARQQALCQTWVEGRRSGVRSVVPFEMPSGEDALA